MDLSSFIQKNLKVQAHQLMKVTTDGRKGEVNIHGDATCQIYIDWLMSK